MMAYAHPTPTSRGLTIHGSLVDTSQFSNGPSTGPTSGLSISQPDITEISAPSPTVYQSSPLRARSPASIAGIPLLSPLTNSKSAASGGPMKAAEIKPVLEMKLAYLSGGRDREGRTIVTIPALQKGSERPREELANTLYYLVNTVSEEVRENGFCIVVDSRGYGWQTVKQTLRMLQDCLPSQIHVVYIIQQGQFWHRRQSSFSRHSREKSRFEFSTITLSSIDKLLRHIEESQLTSDLGGFLPYNHKEWITFRLNLEQFMGEVDGLLETMALLEQHITKEYMTEDVEGAEKVLQQHCSMEEELKMCPQEVLKAGRDLISSIEQKPDCSGTSSITPDKINAAATIRHLLDGIQRRQRQLEELWRNHKSQHEQNLQLKIFERSVYKVKSWLKGRGMEALSNKQDIGDSMATAEVLWQQHESLEAKAQNIYDNLTQLRLMVDKLCGTKHFASADMRQCIAKLSNRYTFFDARLQERSDILRLSMTLHEHMEQWRQKCEQCREEVMAEGLSLDDNTETQDKLMEELRQSGELLMQEGHGLLEMMHQQAELQMPHPPDYKKSARYVRNCLDEVEDKRKRVEQLSEARKVRLDQFKQVHTCEKDAKQALQDLEHLLRQLSSCLGDLGNSLATTTKLRDEHTKITRAAKKTHEYGRDLLSAASKGRQACGMPQKPNQALLELLSATWNSVVSRGNQHTNWLDMLMTFYTGQREVQQQLSWLQQQSSGKLPELDEAESSLATIKETGPSTKQTAADTLDLGSDLLDELEQAKHFPTRDAACRSMRQQLEKLSALTKQHAILLEDSEKKLKDCIELQQLDQQTNKVIHWMQQSGEPHLLPSLGKDLRTCEEQLSQLEAHNEAIEEYSKKADELLKLVSTVEYNQYGEQLQQIDHKIEQQWKTFCNRWKQREQRLLAAIQYYTTINHLQQQFELFEGHMRLADLPEEADEIELHLEKTQGDRKDLLNTFRQALEDGRAFTEQLIHGEQEDVDLPAAEGINEELDQLDKQRIKLDELWIKTQKYLNQTLEFQQKQQLHVSSLSPSEWLGTIAEPFISSMSVGTTSSEADEVIAKLDIYVKQAEDYHKQLGQNRGHVKDALRRAREELQGRRGLLLQLRLLYSNVERCQRKLDALKDKQDPSLKEKAMHSVNEILKEGTILISQLEHFPLSSVRQVEMVCDRLKEKAGLSKRGSFSADQSHQFSSSKTMSKTDITKQLEAFKSASESFLVQHTELGDTVATAQALLKQYQRFQDATEPMIRELEKAWQHRSKGADLKDVYERFRHSTQSCRQVVTKRLTIITSLVEYHEQWQMFQDSVRELDELLQEPFKHSCTQLDAHNQLENGRPVLQELHGSHDQCRGYGKQFLEMASSEGEHSSKSPDHISSLKMSLAAARIKQQLDEADRRVQRLNQQWEEREHLLSHCIQGHALQMDCKKVSGELQKMLDSLEVVDLGTSLETSEQLSEEHHQALQRLRELEQEVEELQEDADDMTEDNHYNASSLTEATLSLRSLYKKTQTKMNERQQLLESCGNFFARSVELMQDFDTVMREKVCRPAKLEGFSSRLSALCSEGTSLIAMARASVGRGLRSEKVLSQGVDDTIASLQHKMQCYKKLDKRASVYFTSSSSGSASKNISKRFSMGNFDDYPALPKLELASNPLSAASRLFPEKKREGLRRAGSMRVERSSPVQKLSSKFERSSVDDTCKPTPPERVDSFKYLKNKRKTSVNSLRQKFEQLSIDQTTPTSSMEDLSATQPAGAPTSVKNTELSGKDSPGRAKRTVPPVERANTMPPLGSPKASPPTKRFNVLKQASGDRSESPKVSPQAIEAILESLSLPDSADDGSSKLVGGVAAGNRLSQHLHEQLPQLEESSDEELSKEMELLSTATGIDESDYGIDEPDYGKEKLKSLSAITSELITGEAQYLQSLQCIVDGYIPAWDRPYLAAFLVGKKEIIFSNLTDIYHFQIQFYKELLNCKGVQEICKCFKTHEEEFSLYLVYLKALPQGKKVLSDFGGDFFEMIRKEKRYSRSFITNYLHPSDRLNQYISNFREMINAAQKEELHSVNVIRDTLKIFLRIDRISAFTCITENPETLDEKDCLLMDDFMVYTVKKKKKRAEEMRVFLHDKCVIFTKTTTSTEESSLSNHRVFEYLSSITVNSVKLSETVEKGKHPEKFGLAENKAGPDREYILQPVSKSVEVKQEWCTEVNKLLLQQLEKIKQTKAHDSGSNLTETLPPPMTHVVELPSRFHKHKKMVKRDSDGGRGSVAARGNKHDSKHELTNVRNSEDIRHISIELPQPMLPRVSTGPVGPDRTIMYETTEPYDGSGKDGYLTLDKGCQVEVLDKSGTDWLVCTVAETCAGVEKEGMLPKHILTPVTRQSSRAISKQVSTTSSVSKRYSYISVHSNFSEQSTTLSTTTGPSYLDDDLYVIVPPPKISSSGKVSQPMIPTTSPPSRQQYVYYAIKDYHPNKEGYVRLTAGESVEVLDKSNPKEWVIATVDNEERPSEEGLVPAEVLSAEYVPIRYESLQGEYSGSDEGRSSGQLEEPPPIPPHHPNHDNDAVQPTTGSHDMNKKETGVSSNSPLTEPPQVTENPPETEISPQAETRPESSSDKEKSSSPKPDTEPMTMEETHDEDETAEDASSEQSDTTPVVSPKGSLHSGSTHSSPMPEKRDVLPPHIHNRSYQLSKSLTAVELNVPSIMIGSKLSHYGSDPALQELVPLSDSSPGYSISNLVAGEGGKSPMHERVSSILRESLLSSARSRHHSINLGGPAGTPERKRAHPSSVASPIASSMVAELKDILGRSRSCDAGSGIRNKTAGHHDDRSSSISPEVALTEMKKLQQESVEQSSDSNKMEEYDQIEIYVAIADYVPDEESNIPLHCGQHVQVLDCSREDWWLVIPMATTEEESSNEPLKEGWVPGNHLEKLISAGSHDPSSHDPSSHDTEQLRELYNCSFLVDDPSPTQLEGMFSIAHPYMAKEAIQGTMPGQLSLHVNQIVQVLDSKSDDWWLVATMATDKVPSIKGWVPASSLVAKSNDEALSSDQEQPPVWYVRATFQSEGEGMLSIQEGELVVVVDSSSEEWYYAKTVQRDPPCEGWVPASYIYQLENTDGFDIPTDFVEALDSPWLRSAHQNSQSESSSEFDDDDETQLLHEHLVSPDITEGLDGEDRRQVAHEKRTYVIGELIESEKDYVEKLRYCIENYVTAVISSVAPKTLYGMKDTLFCNMEAIHDFHRSTFLPQLEQCSNDHLAVANCFVSHADKLEMYVNYCTYQAKSDSVFKEYCGFFADLCAQLKDRWQLADYLILPVQRITKYSLLLEHILKYSIRAGEDCDEIDAALDITRGVSLRANNAIHLSMLDIDEKKQKSYGTFIMQEKFDLLERVEGGRTRLKDRRLFLFEHILVLSKKRRDDSADQETYFIKETLKLNELSATQDKDNAGLGLILYEMHSGNKYTLRAPSVSIRDGWYSQLHKLISVNKVKKDTLKRAISEPTDSMGRSPSIPRKSVFGVRREPAKKSKHMQLEGVLSNPSSVAATDDTEAQPGTQFLVLERIVMEGGDDLQLEPGEVVELVRKENNSTLYVRTLETTDAPAMEGNVPASFLRRKCVHKQSGLSEAMPKITKRPSNQTVSVGDTVTFSSIFNGFPAPSVTWRKASVTLTTSDRCKITVLSNSTLFELTDVKFSDAGIYACVVANSAGTDTATVELSVVGPPDAPTHPIASKVATTSLKLKWTPPEFDGNSEITTYQVEQLQEGLNEWLPIVQQPKTLFVVKTLEPNTSYQFRIIAYNEYGPSQPSEPSQTVFTKSTNKGFLTAASPSFRKKTAPIISSSLSDSKGNDVTDFDFLSQQPPLMGNMLGLPSLNQSLSQPPMEDPVFSSTIGSPPPSYIRTTPITVSYDLTLEELGRGRYGIVQKCISKKTQEAVAAKYLRLRTKKRLEIRREADLHQRLLHPHIITFFDAYEAGRNLIIVMEIATGGELLDYIVQTKTLTEAIAVKYLSQVISALQYMHSLGVAHMDIRPENILLSSNQEPIVKLIDLGSARDLSLHVTHPSYGSPEFCAPEILNKETVHEAADMWGLGALTYVILSGVSPFFGDNPQITRFHIKEGRYDFNAAAFEQVSQDAKDFIRSLLQLHPQDRLSAKTCQEHAWIKTLNPKGTGVPSWPMAKLDLSRLKTFIARRKWHSSNIAVETNHVFGGRIASIISRNSMEPSDLQDGVPPNLSGGPDNLVVNAADTVSFCHQVQGTPTPSIQWEHNNKQLLHSARVKITNDGINVSLTILDVGRLDEGVYTCTALNSLGSMSAQTKLVVLDKPLPPSDLNSVSLGNNSALVSWSRPSHDGSSPITGYLLEHKRSDQDTWVLSAEEIHSTAHVVDDLLPGNSYQFRVAAVNAIGCSQFSKPSGAVSVDSSPEEEEWDNMEAVKIKYTPFEQEYTFKDVISKGSFSAVRVCVENSTDRLYAAKVINLDGKQRSAQALHEFDMLASLSHPRIVTIEGAFQSPTKFVLVMEYLSGGELLAHLAKKEMLNEEEYSHYIRQVLEGLHYIHSNNIIHMAVKPANIVLTSNHRDIKLVDFRLARYIQAGNQLEAIEGNPEFLAPETVSLKPVTTAADIWSVGIITCIMLTGVSPFLAKDQTTTIACIQAARLDNVSTVLNEVSHDAKDFIINNVLKTNPRRRLTAAQLLRHRWLQANSQLKVSRSSSIQETGHLKQFVQHRKVSHE